MINLSTSSPTKNVKFSHFQFEIAICSLQGLDIIGLLESPYSDHHTYFHFDQIPRSQDVLEKSGGSFF